MKSPPTASNWSTIAVAPPKPTSRELKPQPASEREAANIAKAGKGRNAETALLSWVHEETTDILIKNGKKAWNELLAAAPEKGRTRDALERARTQFEQENAFPAETLHISSIWGSAGFDLLGLKVRDSGSLEAVRYEVKAIPDRKKDQPIAIHLSMNELAVYREVSAPASPRSRKPTHHRKGCWQLVGVEKNGQAHDLTRYLSDIQKPDSSCLKSLADSGFEPEGLILYLRPEKDKG